jgi:integrase
MNLREALEAAVEHWEGRPGEANMELFARKCVEALEAAGYPAVLIGNLETRHALDLLKVLQMRGLSPKTVACYYGAFRRMLALCGVTTEAWPKPESPKRAAREVASEETIEAAIQWLRGKGWSDTADLVHLILHTGLRVRCEAQNVGALKVGEGAGGDAAEVAYDVLEAAGREIPVVDPEARAILWDKHRMACLRATPYTTHVGRISRAAAAVGVSRNSIEPASLRAAFGRRVLANSGGNLTMVQELLGHSDPATTSRFLVLDQASREPVAEQPVGEAQGSGPEQGSPQVRGVVCPVCQAPKGEPCYGPRQRKPRISHHSARHDLAKGRPLRLPRHPKARYSQPLNGEAVK